jgi:hypothetical protein
MDIFTRGVRRWHLGRSLDHTLPRPLYSGRWPSILHQRSTTLTEIKRCIGPVAKQGTAEVVTVEVGGTMGDIEGSLR